MKVRIVNHDAYGPFVTRSDKEIYAVGTVHEILYFYPDTGEVDLGDKNGRATFAPSEYVAVRE